jgi:hypothetical protein
MISIAGLLFAVTVVLMFALLLIFYSFGCAGNGGEYWGFDGYIDAREAAAAPARYMVFTPQVWQLISPAPSIVNWLRY